ncbi:MAG TPA: hypothetical protein VLB05_05490 [Dongiaceae bacterium]|jgi:hypothetical protein|nr:hypothetical protein [Dongiaceae bacterium]
MAKHRWIKLKPDDPIFSGQYVVSPIRSERALPGRNPLGTD